MTKRKRKAPRPSPNTLSEELDLALVPIAKQMAGKPLGESLDPTSGSLLSQLMGRLVELSMQEEMTEHLGYEPGQRIDATDEYQGEQRANHRNGFSERTLVTSQGQTTIRAPRDRDASFDSHLLPKRKRLTQEMEDRFISMYSAGMSTRDIEAHIREIYGVEVSAQFVSRLTRRMDEELTQWRSRPLDAVLPIVFVDAIHVKIRHQDGVKPTAVYQVCAYNEDGHLEIVGLYLPDDGSSAESATFWSKVFIDMNNRGVEDVLILCSDGLSGLKRAAQARWPEVEHQPCVVHLVRASTKYLSYTDRKEVCAKLKTIYGAPSYEEANRLLEAQAEEWEETHPEVLRQWRANLEDLQGMWRYGKGLRKMVYTTNAIENVHSQQRRVLKTKGSFPNPASALRLMTILARKITEKNTNRKRSAPRWRSVVADLHILFEDRIPSFWGGF